MNSGPASHRDHHIAIIVRALSLVWFAWLAIPLAHAQKLDLTGDSDIPFPESPPVYCQPVTSEARIIQGNGGSFSHNQPNSWYAWDYDVPIGTPVVAARSGVVFRIWNHSNVGGRDRDRFIEYGNFILIDHLDGTFAQYFHLAKDSFTVGLNEYVLQGEQIASSGDTGFLLGPHLHYAVFDTDDYKSISTRFFDFKMNGGVPEEGDRVPAARPSLVPSKVIQGSKKAFYASRKAETMGMVDLAWLYASNAPKTTKHADYFYIRVLEKRAGEYEELLCQRLEALAELEMPSNQELVEAARYAYTLDDIDDRNLNWLLYNLRKRIAEWEKQPSLQATTHTRAIDTWVKGMRLECEGQVIEAAYGYIDTLAQSVGPVHDKALTRLKLIIGDAHAELKFCLSRCIEDHKRATDRHARRVKEYTHETWLKYRPLLLAWAVYFPKERRRAMLAMDEIKLQVKSITGF